MRYWRIARTALIGWMLVLGLWVGLAMPDFLTMVAVWAVGTFAVCVALGILQRRAGPKVSAEHAVLLTRRDQRLVLAGFAVVIGVAFVRALQGP